ncbi:MAG TPA: glycosyltransferase family 4 protein, partial [Armatimonadota bacterium]
LSEYCTRIGHCTIDRSMKRNLSDAGMSVAAGRSFIISRDWRTEMQNKVLEALHSPTDLIYVDHLQMFQFVPDPSPCPVLLDEHNVEWRIIERFSQTGSASGPFGRAFARLEWPKLRAYELKACTRADRVLTVTPQDAETLSQAGVPSERLSAVPIGVDTDYFKPLSLDPDSRRIISIGTMSWPPNIDALTFFCKSVYPAVKEGVPDVTFSIVGANPTEEIRALAVQDESIEVTGFVDDIRTEAQGSAVFVVPLRIGSGMRVKILDAMALGLPVVTTSVGCEGIALTPSQHALVADEPADFAAAVVRLLNDPQERERLGTAGRRLVEDSYSWPPILSRLDDILSALPNPTERLQPQ